MPQNPLDLLKRLAMTNVPVVPPNTPQEIENNDLRAAALQENDPTWKKVGRGAIDALTGFFTEDPAFDEDFAKQSYGTQIGGVANMLPLGMAVGGLKKVVGELPRLPMIHPAAYDDVKAGGLKLYSRLTNALAGNGLKQMQPNTIRGLAKSASAEEVKLRKLEEFLTGRDPMEKIPKAEVLKHLADNPLNLDVVRKTGNSVPQAQADFNQLVHELDTQHGSSWRLHDPNASPEDTQLYSDTGFHVLSPEETERYNELSRLAGESPMFTENSVAYDSMQTPGARENYGETLINTPDPRIDALNEERNQLAKQLGEFKGRTGMGHMPGSSSLKIGQFRDKPAEWADEYFDLETRYDQVTKQLQEAHAAGYTTPHWYEKNNLVWSRHNDRYLDPSDELAARQATIDKPAEFLRNSTNDGPAEEWANEALKEAEQQPMPANPGTGKGRFIEEIQSDWHQTGRERGYRNPKTEQDWKDYTLGQEHLNEMMRDLNSGDTRLKPITDTIALTNTYDPNTYSGSKGFNRHSFGSLKDVLDAYETTPQQYQGLLSQDQHDILQHYLDLRKSERATWQQMQNQPLDEMVPDAPFKTTYPDLALKQQLLDASNDPEIDWLGVADADTSSKMEGHIDKLGDPNIKAGMEKVYNERHPSALQKLLNPFGGQVEYANLPSQDEVVSGLTVTGRKGFAPSGKVSHSAHSKGGDNVFTFTGPQMDQTHFNYADENIEPGRQLPGPGMWAARLTPEMKEAIKKRGFPAMAALLALQSQRDRFNNGEQ